MLLSAAFLVDTFSGALGRLLREPAVLWAMLLVVAGFFAPRWHRIRRFVLSGSARNWPTVPASIDVVSIVEHEIREKGVLFVATLTYFYRNPELQIGEYERAFSLKSAAESWVEQFKLRQAMVHVNPRRPDQSALLDDEIEALTLRPAPELQEALLMERIPELPRGYRLLSSIAELVGLAGLAATTIMLGMCIAHGGESSPKWQFWTAGIMLAFVAVSLFVVLLRAEDEREYQSFLQTYSIWCPAWMRWSLNISAGFFTIFWFMSRIAPDLMKYLLMGTEPLAPYIFFLWGFLAATGFHAAIVRTQEQSIRAGDQSEARRI